MKIPPPMTALNITLQGRAFNLVVRHVAEDHVTRPFANDMGQDVFR